MLIDLDKVIEQIKPHDVQIRIGGVTHKVKRLSVAEAKQFDEMPKENEALIAFVGSLFIGEPPVALAKAASKDTSDEERVVANEQVLLLIRAISTAYMEQESLQKKLERAREGILAQIRSSSAGTA